MTPRKAKAILTSCEKQIPQLLESEIHGVKSLTEGMIRKSPLVKVEEWNTRTLFGLSWAKGRSTILSPSVPPERMESKMSTKRVYVKILNN